MKQLNRTNFNYPKYPTKIVQFGEGNFLRGFIDWQLDLLNEESSLNAGVAVIRPIDYDAPLLNEQDGLYTTVIRGMNEEGVPQEQFRIIRSINEEIPVYKAFDQFIQLAENPELSLLFSNTTEAGIDYNAQDKLDDKPAKTYPAKLTQWLYHRYTFFNGAVDKGLFIIPCELIDYNGEKLKQIVLQYISLWNLDNAFKIWVETANIFCSTLVDRIVTGHPRDEHDSLQEKVGYLDRFMVTAEYFYLFVIQAPTRIQQEQLSRLLCLDQFNLNIKIVDDIAPYKERKVAILNGAHTAMVPLAYLSGLNTVGETMTDPILARYIDQLIKKEIIPTLSLSETELLSFAHEVLLRFKNPYIQHQLLSISLNSMTKFTTRLVPQLMTYLERHQHPPQLMTLAFAAQCLFYKGERDGLKFELVDNKEWLDFFGSMWENIDNKRASLKELISQMFLSSPYSEHWGVDFSKYPQFMDAVLADLTLLLEEKEGIHAVISEKLSSYHN